MAEVTLKKKITLKRKGESIAFTFSGRLKIKLIWGTDTDQDLCLFFKRKDGAVGGVFSDEYRNKRSDLGDLNKFPYMLHMGDRKDPQPGNEEIEQINVSNLNEIDKLVTYVGNTRHFEVDDVRKVVYDASAGLVDDLCFCTFSGLKLQALKIVNYMLDEGIEEIKIIRSYKKNRLN